MTDQLRNLLSTLVGFSFVLVFRDQLVVLLGRVRHTSRVPHRNLLLPVKVVCSSTADVAVDLERNSLVVLMELPSLALSWRRRSDLSNTVVPGYNKLVNVFSYLPQGQLAEFCCHRLSVHETEISKVANSEDLSVPTIAVYS